MISIILYIFYIFVYFCALHDRRNLAHKGSSIKDALAKSDFLDPPSLSNIVQLGETPPGCVAPETQNVRNAKQIAIQTLWTSEGMSDTDTDSEMQK